MLIARVTVFAAAIAVCAWFVIGARQAHDLGAATAIVTSTGHLTSAQSAQASSLLHGAAFLNPDRQVKLTRAHLELRDGNDRGAIALAEQVTRAEPDNAVAWYELATDAGSEKSVLLDAFRHIRALVPPLPRAH